MNGPHSIYRIFAADGTLLYIGCAYDIEHRIYMHRWTSTMVDAHLIQRHYDHHTSVAIGTLVQARAAEREAILTERPILNRQHNPTRWRRVSGQYVPVDADTLETYERLSARPEPDPEFAAFFESMFASARLSESSSS